MLSTIVGGAVLFAGGILAAFVYVKTVGKNMTTYAQAVGKTDVVRGATSLWGKISAAVDGWKTHILALVAGLAQAWHHITADVIQGWGSLPWSTVVDAKIANWITFVCLALVPITHSMGIAKAAQTPPADSSSS